MLKQLSAVLLLLPLLFSTPQVFAASRVVYGSSPRIKVREGTSTNWSGYAVETNLARPLSNAVSNVQGSWVVPVLDCSSLTHTTYSSAWVGIDGYSDNTVEQTGTEHDCVNGVAQYSAWYEMYPKFPVTLSMTLHANDVMFGQVTYVGNNAFRLTLTDQTTGQSFSTIQKAKAKRQSAEWIVEAPYSGGVLPLANFGTMNFSGTQATLNGRTDTISAFANDPITMVGTNYTKATPSALTSDGSGFSVTWSHE